MQNNSTSVVYILFDKLGGVFNYVDNLLSYRRPDAFLYHAILTDNLIDRDVRSNQKLSADQVIKVDYSLPRENLYSVLKRLARVIPPGQGVLVCNDWLELAMLSVYKSERTIINVTHGDFDYYYDLALKHEASIDCFLTYTRRMYNRLSELLPQRRESIFNIPYGVKIPRQPRTPKRGKLRLLYVGRMNSAKGIFDLPKIDERLRELGIEASWTLQGAGPDELELRNRWQNQTGLQWTGMQPMEKVFELYQHHDVLVMPSRSEGLPVALLEASAAGVVPVVSDLLSGIPEVVDHGVNGYRPPVGDIQGFASAIAELDRDRDRLEVMSRAVRQRVVEKFDILERAANYQALYARWRELRRPRSKRLTLHYGSRLDKPWIPNAVVRVLRSALGSRPA